MAEAVVAANPVPVLVQCAWQPPLGEPLLDNAPKMIVPLDGSAFAESALEPAARLAEELGGRLILVRVEDNPTAIHAMLEYLPRVLARVRITASPARHRYWQRPPIAQYSGAVGAVDHEHRAVGGPDNRVGDAAK